MRLSKTYWKVASPTDGAVAVKLGWKFGPEEPGQEYARDDLTLRWYKDEQPIRNVHSHIGRPARIGFHPSEKMADAEEILTFLRGVGRKRPFRIIFEPLQDGPLPELKWECIIREPESVRLSETYGHSFGGSPAAA
jgi:hypothetical protein